MAVPGHEFSVHRRLKIRAVLQSRKFMQNDNQQQPPLAVVLKQAMELHQAGRLDDAAILYRQVLERDARHFDALYCLGMIRAQTGRNDAALELIEAAVKSNPGSARAHLGLGNVHAAAGRFEQALESYDRALALEQRFPEAWYGRGNALLALKRNAEAATSYDRALALAPDWPEALTNSGNALHDLGRNEDALQRYDRAIALMPGVAMLHNNRGNLLRDMRRWREALESLGKALVLEPRYFDAIINRGNVLQDLERFDEALAAFDLALSLEPDHPVALNNRANVLRDLRRHEEAAKTVARLLELAPEWDYAPGLLFQSLRHACDWRDYGHHVTRIVRDVGDGKKADFPFAFLAVSDSAADQKRCAFIYAADRYPASPAPLWTGERYRHERIRIAYLSADFHDHATAYLMAGLFERHDRERFEVTAVSFGPDAGDEMRSRLRTAFESFVDVRDKTDRDVALLMRDLEIDIAVDLKGFTADSRAGIFAHRPAPIHVNYLGYPGTLGADYMDYILADKWVIPPEHQPCFTENVVYLPESYQVNDQDRGIAGRTLTRSEAGLPEAGFVFCCFNNNYKITPETFAVWMRLLARVPGSVLWLLSSNPVATRNLKSEAGRRGIAPERLIFAPQTRVDEHLARHRLADLFLDTAPYNAHTTASDALWAGLPVLTLAGDAFAARVAASLLNAVGLPELITHSIGQYEELALRLAENATLLMDIRSRLARARTTCSLFDTDRFRRHIESAFLTMWKRYQRGEPPTGFAVEPVS